MRLTKKINFNPNVLLLIAVLCLLSFIHHEQLRAKNKPGFQQAAAHFHHVHLNSAHPERTIAFYEHYFGANRINYRNKSKALFTEKSFILIDSVKNAPLSNLGSSLWHIGWSGVDGASEFQWRVQDGIAVQTPLTPLIANSSLPHDTSYYMYFRGPDRELIEVYTGNRNHRFEHVHLLSSNIETTTAWFKNNLGLTPLFSKAIPFYGVQMNIFKVDNVNLILFARQNPPVETAFLTDEIWPKAGLRVTDGTAIDHIAFSYETIEPVMEQMKSSGLPIVRNITTDPALGLTSFFVRGPDGLLVEIVKEKPVPEGIWEK